MNTTTADMHDRNGSRLPSSASVSSDPLDKVSYGSASRLKGYSSARHRQSSQANRPNSSNGYTASATRREASTHSYSSLSNHSTSNSTTPAHAGGGPIRIAGHQKLASPPHKTNNTTSNMSSSSHYDGSYGNKISRDGYSRNNSNSYSGTGESRSNNFNHTSRSYSSHREHTPRRTPTHVQRPSTPLHQNNWLVSLADMQNSPSINAGFTFVKETSCRMKGCMFMATVGMAINVTQTSIGIACVLLHRFYLRNSLKDFDFHDVGAACLFLACKIHETPKRFKDLIIACARKSHKDDSLPIIDGSKEFRRWQETILYHEEIVLTSLCFDLNVDTPYDILMRMGTELNVTKQLRQIAWSIVNDILRTTLCVRSTPSCIAAGSLLFAIRILDDPDGEGVSEQNFWELCKCDHSKVEAVMEEIIELYSSQELSQHLSRRDHRKVTASTSRK
ncbi:hypothetical protein MT418_001719 [Batrachochytrium dendrobatidis]